MAHNNTLLQKQEVILNMFFFYYSLDQAERYLGIYRSTFYNDAEIFLFPFVAWWVKNISKLYFWEAYIM